MPPWDRHQLYLFWCVAKHRGITAALPHIGYGIQQPAVSQALIELEKAVGRRLFNRKPFRLLPDGEAIFRHIDPAWEAIQRVQRDFVRREPDVLRIGSTEFALRQYLIPLADELRRTQPGVRYVFQSGPPGTLLTAFRDRRLDVLVSTGAAPPEGCSTRVLLHVPLVLVVPRTQAPANAEDLLPGGRSFRALVCPSNEDVACHLFDAGLKRRGFTWHPDLFLPSISSVCWRVNVHDATGLAIALPTLFRVQSVTAVPLEGFGQICVYAAWHEPASLPVRKFVAAVERRAEEERRVLAQPL